MGSHWLAAPVGTGYQMRAPFSLCPKRPAGSPHLDRGEEAPPKAKRGRPQGPRGASRFGQHFVAKCAHPARRGPGAAAPAAQHSPPGGCPRLAFELPSVPVLGTCRPLRAYGEVRAHIAPGKLSAATPTAGHARP